MNDQNNNNWWFLNKTYGNMLQSHYYHSFSELEEFLIEIVKTVNKTMSNFIFNFILNHTMRNAFEY